MNFRAKIWMMPASAALLFTAGLSASLMLGSELSNSIRLLRQVDEPYLAQVMRVDRAAELVQSIVQSATIEGDIDKLGDVTPSVKTAHEALAAIDALEGKQGGSQTLREAFDAYQVAAVDAAKTMLAKTGSDPAGKVSAMQSTLTRFNELLQRQKASARAGIDSRYNSASASSTRSLLVMVVTGMLILAVLGFASWAIVRSVWRELGDEPEQLRKVVGRIASGELGVASQMQRGSAESVDGALAGMTGGLRTMITDIREVANSIRVASSEIAAGNQDLSERTEQTASNLQQAASSMEELTVTVRHTAASASTANNLASEAMQAATRGGSVVDEVVANMLEIDSSSRKISEIIGVIDGIAFQTNILALNAAVEAARAGEQGRGFAVVANEVRTLAHRSATAAKEIKALILTSSEKIGSGARLVRDAGSTMQEVVLSVKHVNDIISEIAVASGEQSIGIGAVTVAVNELDRMTQENSALVEQSAAAAESLSQQTERLTDSVSRFRLEAANQT